LLWELFCGGEPRLDDKRLFLNSDHLDSSPIWKRIFGRVLHRAFLPAIQVFARFFGKIMPIWMAGTLLFHLSLLWLTLAMAGLPHSISYFSRHSLDHDRCV
jgi:hypothetical protein